MFLVLPHPKNTDELAKQLVDSALIAVRHRNVDSSQTELKRTCSVNTNHHLKNIEANYDYSQKTNESDCDQVVREILACMSVAENLQMPDIVTDYTVNDLLNFDPRSLRLLRDTYAYKIGMYVTLREEVVCSLNETDTCDLYDADRRKLPI